MTQLQVKAFTAIVNYHATHGYAPSVREIAKTLCKSMAVTHATLEALREKKMVAWVTGCNRTLHVLPGAA